MFQYFRYGIFSTCTAFDDKIITELGFLKIIVKTAHDRNNIIDTRRRKHGTQHHEQQQYDVHGLLAFQVFFQYPPKHRFTSVSCIRFLYA